MDPMDLVDLLRDHTVYIQTHDYPDPDAISSAFGLQQFLLAHNVASTLCYKGKIDRINTKKMLDTFGIAMYATDILPKIKQDDFLVLIDSQKPNSNITSLPATEVACIDHHPIVSPYGYQYQDIQKTGSCACIIASYYQRTGVPISPQCAAALAYGIKMDTADLTRGICTLDMEMLSFLFAHADWSLVTQMYSNTMEFDDLRAYGAAIQNIKIFNGTGFAYIPFHSAQALVAIISDFILSLDVVSIAVVYAQQAEGIRFSIRCCKDLIHAGNLAARALRPFGSGGGHASMAGGMIPSDHIYLLGENIHASIQKRFLCTIAEMEAVPPPPGKHHREQDADGSRGCLAKRPRE